MLCAAVVLLVTSQCLAADNSVPVNDLQSTESFIGDWLVLGMFDNPPIKGAKEGAVTRAGFDTDYLTSLGGEGKAVITPLTVVTTDSGKVGPAKLVKADPAGFVSLDPLFKDTDYKLVYAYCNVRSERDQMAYGHSGSNDGIKIWVNGEEVLSFFTEERNAGRDQNHFAVKLHRGLNCVLVKIDNKSEDWNFTLELYGERYEKGRFPFRVEGLNVMARKDRIDASEPVLPFKIEFQPHSPAFSPEVDVVLETLDGRQLTKTTATIGAGKTVAVPADAGAVLVLKASTSFAGRSLTGSAKVLRGDLAAIKKDLLGRLAKVSSASPKGMPEAAWARHLALVKYYGMLLSLDGSPDGRVVAVLRARNATPCEIVPEMNRVLDALEAGTDILVGQRGGFRAAYISKADDSAQPYMCYVPEDYDASRVWPLRVELHGAGGTSGTPDTYNYKRDYLAVRVDGRGMACGYINLAENDILEVIADMRRHYSIDPDRIVINGASMGGFGAWHMASRYPDLFAAAASFCGAPRICPIENLANVPLWCLHDQIDWSVPIDMERWGFRLLNDWGYPARMNESNGFGHNAPGGATAAGLNVTGWLLDNRRDGAPAKIVYTTHTPRRGRAYWVNVREFSEPSRTATIRAQARDNSRLDLTLVNVDTLEVNPPASLFGKSATIEVAIDKACRINAPAGQPFFVHRKGNAWEILKEDPVRPGAVRLYDIGGLSNLYQGEPMLIVQGTSGGRKIVAAMARLAGEMKGYTGAWDPMDFETIPVKLDSDVTDEDMRTRNLILIGGASQNAVTKRIAARLVAQEKSGKIVIDGKLSYDLAGCGYMLYHYNPLAPDKLVYVIASGEEGFYKFRNGILDAALAEGWPLDFGLFDVDSRRLVRAISWNRDWKPAARFIDSPKLPGQFANADGYWREMAAALRDAARADFAVCFNPAGEDRARVCFDTSAATWADLEVLSARQTVLAAEVTGAELLTIASAAQAGSRFEIVPAPPSASINPAKKYTIALLDELSGPLARIRHKNLDTIHFVTCRPIDEMRKRLTTAK